MVSPASYTHVTLATIWSMYISVVAASDKKTYIQYACGHILLCIELQSFAHIDVNGSLYISVVVGVCSRISL